MIIKVSSLMSARLLFWAPVIAASVHIFEEFVFPGGFAPWYRRCRPGDPTITSRKLVLVNALMLYFCLCAGINASTPLGAAVWLVVMGTLFANAIFHIYSSFRMGEYSPGMITATCAYIPLTIVGTIYLLRSGLSTRGTVLANILIGISIMLFVDLHHFIGRAIRRDRKVGEDTSEQVLRQNSGGIWLSFFWRFLVWGTLLSILVNLGFAPLLHRTAPAAVSVVWLRHTLSATILVVSCILAFRGARGTGTQTARLKSQPNG